MTSLPSPYNVILSREAAKRWQETMFDFRKEVCELSKKLHSCNFMYYPEAVVNEDGELVLSIEIPNKIDRRSVIVPRNEWKQEEVEKVYAEERPSSLLSAAN